MDAFVCKFWTLGNLSELWETTAWTAIVIGLTVCGFAFIFTVLQGPRVGNAHKMPVWPSSFHSGGKGFSAWTSASPYQHQVDASPSSLSIFLLHILCLPSQELIVDLCCLLKSFFMQVSVASTGLHLLHLFLSYEHKRSVAICINWGTGGSRIVWKSWQSWLGLLIAFKYPICPSMQHAYR